ncbi:hypothetical protein EUGRSUZ_F02351 [Eucalyptus grandis]|uniref:Uncharacterized protein n=2 Tax=Eucalyptus grandis TaxID=71139 RepID=A0ACC3KGJ4_EUCGR|nr:hypothetical protein EUGRSUZ_F02351 [Eucalyptus grandis]
MGNLSFCGSIDGIHLELEWIDTQLELSTILPYKVSQSCRCHKWNRVVLATCKKELIDIQAAICGVLFPNHDGSDKVLFMGAKDGKFTNLEAWNLISQHGLKVNWHRFVWFKSSIPQHGFTLWLTLLNRLQT